jgi:hypothetical protein
MNYNLEEIKKDIEKMNKTHHIEVLRILKKNGTIKLNENKSGVFVNLSFLSPIAVEEIINYVNYVKDQENSIQYVENQKEEYKNIFFVEKEVKDISINHNSHLKLT